MVLIQDHRFIPKSTQFFSSRLCSFKITSSLLQITPKSSPKPLKRHHSAHKIQCCSKPINPTSLTHLHPTPNLHAFLENVQTRIGFGLSMAFFSFPPPSISAETIQTSSDKINVGAVILSIDDFLSRYPFAVAGAIFIWLFVIPLTKVKLRKYKPISAINAFRKLREVSEAQLLDIRKEKSVKFIPSPNLKILNKSAVWVEFEKGKEENFLQKVSESFAEPENTILCILDSFDGEALKLAELLHKYGFKEAYAIKGGVRGKNGWLEHSFSEQYGIDKYLHTITGLYSERKKERELLAYLSMLCHLETQEQYFPPVAHMFQRKRKLAMSAQINGDVTSGGVSKINDDFTVGSSVSTSKDQVNNRLP